MASAVEGLDAANVVVLDARTGAVLSLEETVPLSEAGADRADILKARVERLLAAHVGLGRAIVEVSVETIWPANRLLNADLIPTAALQSAPTRKSAQPIRW